MSSYYYRYKTECPRCDKVGEITMETPGKVRVHCGDCLMDHTEIVVMICTPLLHESKFTSKD